MSLDITTSKVLQEQGLSAYENILLMVTKDKTVVRLSNMLYDMNDRLKAQSDLNKKELPSISTNGMEFLELKGMISKQTSMLKMLIPQKASVSYLAETIGKSRQSVRQFLINNFEPEVDFWNEGGKMFVSQDTAVTVLMRKLK
jgi:predicted DNA-binding protein YlxM (UPF0122 family)